MRALLLFPKPCQPISEISLPSLATINQWIPLAFLRKIIVSNHFLNADCVPGSLLSTLPYYLMQSSQQPSKAGSRRNQHCTFCQGSSSVLYTWSDLNLIFMWDLKWEQSSYFLLSQVQHKFYQAQRGEVTCWPRSCRKYSNPGPGLLPSRDSYHLDLQMTFNKGASHSQAGGHWII